VDLAGSTSLVDADNFRAFSVVVKGEPAQHEPLVEALSDLGSVDPDGEHVWLDGAAVKRLAGADAGEKWHADFDNMVGYAQSKGWTDDAGRIRAHIEWADATGE
jgi:hypothetical protein